MSDDRPLRVIFILGSGRCGSTLLNHILDGHPNIVGVSEIAALTRLAGENPKLEEDPLANPFWRNIEVRWTHRTGRPLPTIRTQSPPLRYLPLIPRWRQANEQFIADTRVLFSAIRAQTECTYLVDASKSASRLWLLSRSPSFEVYVIHLVRDGRAVVNSFMRSGTPFVSASRKWTYGVLSGLLAESLHPEDRRIRLRYEDLARQPQREVEKVCGLLGASYQPGMLDYQDGAHRGLAGNTMTYRPEGGIELDTRWRRELTDRHLRSFLVLGGWLNALLGYYND